jgi:putative membrane protein
MVYKLTVLLPGMLLAAASAIAAEPQASKEAKSDVELLSKLHHINQFEIQLAALAKERASQRVRAYAEMIASDHHSADEKVQALAKKKDITLAPPSDPAKMKKEADLRAKLQSARNGDFDRIYLAAMIEGHEKAIALATIGLKRTKDEDLHSFVSSLIPKLMHHRQMARKLLKSVGRT